ncbi:MAG: polysaccharide export protein [Gammaproteobacteria bacterium]|nr:polysaccharide export protein [Gammaproteobacteria bacterium]MCF6230724.1 polysaccharide export protein [Gammaproteobacteria bacterium]
MRLAVVIVGCLSTLLLVGCNAAAQYNSVQAEKKGTPVSLSEMALPEEGDELDDLKYTVQVGDMLNIFVWRNPELSVTVPVRPDGYISIPLVDDLPVVGVTTTATSRQIEALLQSYIKFPKVTVMVTGFGTAYSHQVRVIGQAAEPRALPYRKEMTLLDVLIEVGGLTEFSAGNRAVLIRDHNGEQQKIALKLEDLMEKGDISKNKVLKAGDIVIIPESYF